MKRTKSRIKEAKNVALTHNGIGRTCGECARGAWKNERNYIGLFFQIYCDRADFAYSPKNRQFVTLSGHGACSNFVEGDRKEVAE